MKSYYWLPAILAILSACNPLDQSGVPPVAAFKIIPENGQTIDTFRFDASISDPGKKSSKVYYRWDWDRDGVWDEEFSKLTVTGHRYYKKGTYYPVLGVINSEGMMDTLSVKLIVNQGYSAPHPSFTVLPDTGNVKTRFQFDASGTKDDEDSLGSLRFMWDFTSNGSWDTPLTPNPVTTHIFEDTGNFQVTMEAVDPQNLRRTVSRTVRVTNINPRLVADFKWTPEYGTTFTEFIIDASPSHNMDDPQALLRFSWKLPPFFVWTRWTFKPDTLMKFEREAPYVLELRVMDTAGLVNFCRKTITIYHANLPPSPKFTIGCRRGNIKTQFFFTSWPTLDQESLPTTLEARWDFDGDGQWDTDYAKLGNIYHNYPVAGTYKVYMEARDPDGLSDTTAQFVEVSPWTNETGLIHDQRDGQYYGTVKIGDQWWMSQNLNFAPWDENKDEVEKICYYGTGCEEYGGLYNCYHATREDWYGEVKGICPTGWHMPSRKELETLVSFIGGWDQADKLLPGGPTDFNALYGGFALKTGLGATSFGYRGYAAYFWSFNKMSNPYAPNAWNLTLIKGEKKFYPGWSDMDYYFSVRCVKNDGL